MLQRIKIKADGEKARRFFARLERETEKLPGFRILFGRRTLLLRFPDEETAANYRAGLDPVYTEQEGEPDGTIAVIRGDPGDYLDPGGCSGSAACWEYAGEEGLIRFIRWPDRILACRAGAGRQYIILGGALKEYFPWWASFHWEFHQFALTHGLVFVHSGAVGLDGEGVLISSVGGRGKSTTVLGCLQDGFDYVSDDYLVLDPETSAAYPLYGYGVLNGDSLNLLPELKPMAAGGVPGRPDRWIVDLSAYRGQFRRGMKIRAIVYPRVPSGAEAGRNAMIRRDPLRTGRTQLLVSSACQNGLGVMENQAALHALFGAVSGLPSYELLLSPDRKSNCRALRELINTLSESGQKGEPECMP